MDAHRLTLLVTAALLAALLALGLRLQLWRRKNASRWLHHTLFFLVCLGVALTALLTWWAEGWRLGGRGTALLPALALLLLMPRTQPGRANHWKLALCCAVAFGLGAWAAW
ncbi:hypothetical protein [Deinococcus hopiensis]|uniref:Uncharacterized protein n=1 Tax=Deinococcus hopiensis KR-140 TaxID=695939 RepID=A0A1W1VC67_9DEIO|nr:hypothetical protein [Deinococcus hopiensis]SMB90999.1 hypothetical protein SAMN00790413_00949 [Deinococcus hopiensis KR-140]